MQRLIFLTLIAMCAFAGNSILTRAALADNDTGGWAFAAIRASAGAATLFLLLHNKSDLKRAIWVRPQIAIFLAVYLIGFSMAYRSVDAGLGALLLFGAVQLTMFTGAILSKDNVPMRQLLGAFGAFSGLVLLLMPTNGATTLSLSGAALMMIAGVGWGLFSLAGRKSTAPLLDLTRAFTLSAVPISVIALLVPSTVEVRLVMLAILSGVVTSGIGYALWYHLLPKLGATKAAIWQLIVPVITALAGVLLLSEPVTPTFVIAAILVIGSVAFSVTGRSQQ